MLNAVIALKDGDLVYQRYTKSFNSEEELVAYVERVDTGAFDVEVLSVELNLKG